MQVFEEWTDAEIQTFIRRTDRFKKAGLTDMEADKLGETMLIRDRPESGDDRRICIECVGFRKGACAHGRAALPFVMQRCELFSLRGATNAN